MTPPAITREQHYQLTGDVNRLLIPLVPRPTSVHLRIRPSADERAHPTP